MLGFGIDAKKVVAFVDDNGANIDCATRLVFPRVC